VSVAGAELVVGAVGVIVEDSGSTDSADVDVTVVLVELQGRRSGPLRCNHSG
jgi:hypothetical protein